SAASSPAAPTPTPSPTPTPTPSPTPTLPEVRSPDALPAYMAEELDRDLTITRERLQSETDDYERWEVSYPSGDLTITGILLVPEGEGPFPAVVLNHGHIDRDRYWSGQGVPREQEHLAEQGFVVLHTDYRGHAGSDDTDEVDHTLRVGYVRDAVNAAIALGNEDVVDPDRVGMVGRSMGGGVTLGVAVTHPEVIDAAVVYASVSSLYLDNFRRWELPERSGTAQEVYEEYGDPEESPEFYADLSPRTFFDRIAAADLPVQIHHGVQDDTCPVEWARATEASLEGAGVRTETHYYEDEGHTFEAGWQTSIERTVSFLEQSFED
ncbi:alpha/beta hydrolase family protein, partial [Desertihabitans aurantiacus]|uniref:alpha/beta hydrolase family protein n=1 Tax=Desertihabitans aurantiacus TaxID=2282477 RepID=UPI000DF7A48A